MQKHRKITLERTEKFHTTQSWTDVNLRSILYGQRSPVKSLTSWNVPDLARIPFKDAMKEGHRFKESKVGASFGPSWSTHWFVVEIVVPIEWVSLCVCCVGVVVVVDLIVVVVVVVGANRRD